jgi:hypothetical protein
VLTANSYQEVLNGLLDPEDEATIILQNVVTTVYQSTQQKTLPEDFLYMLGFDRHEG